MTAKLICNRFSILSKIWIYELEILMLSFKKILLPLRWYDLRTAPFFIMDTVLGYRKQCRLPLGLRFRFKIVWGCAKILTLSLLKELSHIPSHVYI